MMKAFASALIYTLAAGTQIKSHMLAEFTKHDNQTHELATIVKPDSDLLAQLLSESGVTLEYEAPSYDDTIDMLYKQFGKRDGTMTNQQMGKLVGEWDFPNMSYFWTDFKLSKDFFGKYIYALKEKQGLSEKGTKRKLRVVKKKKLGVDEYTKDLDKEIDVVWDLLTADSDDKDYVRIGDAYYKVFYVFGDVLKQGTAIPIDKETMKAGLAKYMEEKGKTEADLVDGFTSCTGSLVSSGAWSRDDCAVPASDSEPEVAIEGSGCADGSCDLPALE